MLTQDTKTPSYVIACRYTEKNHEGLIIVGVWPRCDPRCSGVKRHLPWHHAVSTVARKGFSISDIYCIIVNPNGSVDSSIK